MDNRSTIVDCALQLFAQRGYDAVGVQEIVDAARVTKPTLYHYFGNKRGVLDAIVREGFAPLFTQLDTVDAIQGDVPETLRRVTQVYFAFATRHAVLYRLLLAMAVGLPDNDAFRPTEAVLVRQRNHLENVFRAFSAYNGNLRGRELIDARTFQALIHTYVLLAFEQQFPLDSALAQRAVQQFVFGIYV